MSRLLMAARARPRWTGQSREPASRVSSEVLPMPRAGVLITAAGHRIVRIADQPEVASRSLISARS